MREATAFLLLSVVSASGSTAAYAELRAGRGAGSPTAILAHPEAVNPFAYAELAASLWRDGRRQQAAFWFYVFQARTRPWADADTQGDGAAALRASLNDELGTLINGWVGGDLKAWQSIVGRALSYEARLPLAEERPDGVARPAWLARVAKARSDYAAAARRTLFSMDPRQLAAQRRAAGLDVGPLQDPGPALPDTWR